MNWLSAIISVQDHEASFVSSWSVQVCGSSGLVIQASRLIIISNTHSSCCIICAQRTAGSSYTSRKISGRSWKSALPAGIPMWSVHSRKRMISSPEAVLISTSKELLNVISRRYTTFRLHTACDWKPTFDRHHSYLYFAFREVFSLIWVSGDWHIDDYAV